ncbi:alpha/beta hydrolase [Amycolatopsis sp. VC5-11]|uniref:alpha/beta hydrolase n=1 Tax=Amycolatopsis sp. VC5-11 TaxID=3120156 RepID=UPI00300BEBD8
MTFAAVLAAVAALAFVPPGAFAGPGRSGCREVNVEIRSGVLSGTMHGTLCYPGEREDAPLQVLVAGGTYNSSYWSDLGTHAGTRGRSYVATALARGYATLALDRIGTGGSSHPASALVTGSLQTDAVHQVIARARAGSLDGRRYRQVVLVGHSLGSMIAVMVAGLHPRDVDALALTGYSHRIDPAQVAASLAAMHPAADEGRRLDPGYLTTKPGTRPALFHAAADSDPAITAAEESAKDVGASAELADAASIGTAAATSRAITAPVLELNGGRDSWACAAVDCSSADAFRAAEQPNYTRPLTACLLPDAGHAVTLAADRDRANRAIARWLDTVLHRSRPGTDWSRLSAHVAETVGSLLRNGVHGLSRLSSSFAAHVQLCP